LRFLEYKEKTEEAIEKYDSYSVDFGTLVIRSKANTKTSEEIITECTTLNNVLSTLAVKKEKKELKKFEVPNSEVVLKTMGVTGTSKVSFEKVGV
jgi:hypothetical protein